VSTLSKKTDFMAKIVLERKRITVIQCLKNKD
jgi:hypothetical protein